MWMHLLAPFLVCSSSVLLEPPAPEYSRATIDLGIVVSDLEKAVKFYRDDLGFKATTPPGFDVAGDLAKDAGVTDGRALHVATFRIGEGEAATTVKLMAFPDAKKNDQSLVTKGLGPRYLTLFVKDLTAVVERMKARSIPLVGKSPVLLGGQTAIAFVQDPDGNFIEFVGPMKETAAGGASAGGSVFKPLFNGKNLEGWKPLKNAVWKVVDGVLVGEQGPDNAGGWLVTEGTSETSSSASSSA
jgi:lactoylglutathione lyase